MAYFNFTNTFFCINSEDVATNIVINEYLLET